MTWAEVKGDFQRRLREAGITNAARLTQWYFSDTFAPAVERNAAGLTDSVLERIEAAAARLVAGEPLQYVTGKAFFYGMQLSVDASVLIPRVETEELVRWILEREVEKPIHFVDLCTGSGCIAAALARSRPDWSGLAVDISQQAVELANLNLAQVGVSDRVHVERHDVLSEKDYLGEGGDWDLFVANPPYIPRTDWDRVDANVAAYEPRLALLVEDASPIAFYIAIVASAKLHLKQGGSLYFECNDRYIDEVMRLLVEQSFNNVEIFTDMQNIRRHIRAVR